MKHLILTILVNMKNRKYLVIGLVILIVFSAGCVENTSPKSKVDEKKEMIAEEPIETTAQDIEKTESTPIPTPTNKVLVEHYEKSVDKLTEYILSDGPKYQYPSPSMTFLVINLKITNKGYSMININKFQWNLKVSTKDNPNAYVEAEKMFSGEADGIVCKDTQLENGGWASCKIPFEAPKNYDQYKLFWNDFNNVNIEWKYTPNNS